jgi:hypothetical protein
MKKLTTTIIGLSLFIGSALTAQDNFTSFYPAENNDTPSYLLDNTKVEAYQTLANSPVEENRFTSFYPSENNDTPDYLSYNSENSSEGFQTLVKSSINHCTLTAFYPEEDVDTRIQTSC